MKPKTPDEVKQQEILVHAKSVLGNTYVIIKIEKVNIEENMMEETTRVSCEVRVGDDAIVVNSTGDGVIDALFKGVREGLTHKYYSLEDITFEDFLIEVDPTTRRKREGTDVSVFVELVVCNSRGAHHHFHSEAKSFNTASVRAVLVAIEYYLNCELAVVKLVELLKDAKERNRTDLINLYTGQLSEIVQSTSYEKTITNWRQKN